MRLWKTIVVLGVLGLVVFAGCLVKDEGDDEDDDLDGGDGNDTYVDSGDDNRTTTEPRSVAAWR